MSRVRAVAVVAVIIGLVACTSAEKREPPPAAGAAEVVVQDNVFTPETLRVRPGTTVTWRNQGFSPHRLAPSDPTQDFGSGPFGAPSEQFREGDRYSYTFGVSGEFDYYCTIHGLPHERMHARVVVTS